MESSAAEWEKSSVLLVLVYFLFLFLKTKQKENIFIEFIKFLTPT